MTTVALDPTHVPAAGRLAVVRPLALQESWRLLRHPVMLAGFALYLAISVWSTVSSTSAREALSVLTYLPSMSPGVFAILAANLVASRDARAGSVEFLTPVPSSPRERVLALCLAALAPAAVMLVATVGYWFVYSGLDRWVETPALGHLLQGPITVAGGALLGVMLAAWAPFRATPVVAVVVMVAANIWLGGREGDLALFGPMVDWAAWGPGQGDSWVGFISGSAGWHAVYLVGLCLAAAVGAVARVVERRLPVVLALVVALTLVVLGGIGQLP